MMCQGECSSCGASRKVNDDHGLCPECIGRQLASAEARDRYRYDPTTGWDDIEQARREMEAYV